MLEELAGKRGADRVLGIARSWVIVQAHARRPRQGANVADDIRRAVIGPVVGLIAGHEVDHFEGIGTVGEGGRQDIGVAQVFLAHVEGPVELDRETAAFCLVQQPGEDR